MRVLRGTCAVRILTIGVLKNAAEGTSVGEYQELGPLETRRIKSGTAS